MGLRINTNTASITALRNLKVSERGQQRSLERLSTGLKINTAADDPSGLVISNEFRAQLNGIGQAIENSERDANLVGTADAALAEVETLLVGIRESVLFALNTGGSDASQIEAEQDAVDSAISAIDRVSATTRFANRHLLNGLADFTVKDATSQFNRITVRNMQFANANSSQAFSVRVTQRASQATLSFNLATQSISQTATIRVTGNLGSEDIFIGAGFSALQIRDAINSVQFNTGVYMSGTTAFYSNDYGSDAFVTVELVNGVYTTTTVGNDTGRDIAGTVNGIQARGRANTLAVSSQPVTGEFIMDDGTSTGTYTFTAAANSGLRFQLNQGTSFNDQETIGIESVDPSSLGHEIRSIRVPIAFPLAPPAQGYITIGGTLQSLGASGANSLTADPTNALRIVDKALDQVSDLRSFLGAFQAKVIGANVSSLNISFEEITTAGSEVRDLDFAHETAEFTRAQILFQAGTAVLAQANLLPQSVLTLLQ